MRLRFFTLPLLFLFISAFGFSQNPRNLLIEDASGPWCPHCACMDTMIERVIVKQYPNTIVFVYQGPQSPFYDSTLVELQKHLSFAGEGSAIPNRNCRSLDAFRLHDSIDALYTRNPESPVKLEISGRTWNAVSRLLTFNIAATALEDGLTGLYRMNVFLIEHHLIGMQAAEKGCARDSLVMDYDHSNVARYMHYSWSGDSLAGPSWPKNQPYSRSISITVPEKLVAGNSEFVIYVDKKGSYPDTLGRSPIQQIVKQPVTGSLGYDDLKNVTSAILKIYPNPATDLVNVHLQLRNDAFTRIALFGQDGKQMKFISAHRMKPGLYNLEFPTTGLVSGIYSLVIENGADVASSNLIIQ